MTALVRKLAIVVGLAIAASSPVDAAPITPGERADITFMQQHEARDVQTGDFRPHGGLTRQQGDSMARGDKRPAAKTPAPATTMPDKHHPY